MSAATSLQQGSNAAVVDDRVSVGFGWNVAGGQSVDADPSSYLLAASGKVRGDEDMIFYNQPEGANGAVRFSRSAGGRGGFEVDLSSVPAAIERIVFCVTIDGAQARNQTLALLDGAEISVGPRGGTPALRFRPSLAAAREAAMTFGELYRRNGQWKFRAVGQGFNGGLAPLARSFGIDIADEPAAAPASPPPPPPPPVPPPPPAINLQKITLAKAGSVRLDKRTGAITAKLKWGGRSGGEGDLDLYCYYVLRDGRCGKIYYRNQGKADREPFITLSGDSQAAGEETIVIHRPEQLRFALFAAYSAISNGVGSFKSFQPRMEFADRSGNQVSIPLLNPVATSYWVAISHISFEAETVISHVETYGQRESERAPRLHADGKWDVSKGEIEFKDDEDGPGSWFD